MFSWLKSIFTQQDDRQSSVSRDRKSARLEDLLKAPGKACSEALLSLAHSVSVDEFIDTVPCPALVGSAIHDGKIDQPAPSQRGTSSFQTFIFTSSQVESFIKGHSAEQSIFLLRKDPTGKRGTDYTQFTVGRAKESDIRIIDFAISRSHARIHIAGNGFTIQDCNSRNGTKVNRARISSSTHPLRDGDTIGLGRYDFTFLTPRSLYARLRGKY